jgi:hypothetical protein
MRSTPRLTIENIQRRIKLLETPVDFDALIKAGILEKQGAWYKLLKIKELPENASIKIHHIQTGPKGILVKFLSPRKRSGGSF